jgi:hypothetical protein
MDNPLAIYLHDHLAGAALAIDLRRVDHSGVLSRSDLTTLKNLADRIGTGSDRLKEFSAWMSEKVSREESQAQPDMR